MVAECDIIQTLSPLKHFNNHRRTRESSLIKWTIFDISASTFSKKRYVTWFLNIQAMKNNWTCRWEGWLGVVYVVHMVVFRRGRYFHHGGKGIDGVTVNGLGEMNLVLLVHLPEWFQYRGISHRKEYVVESETNGELLFKIFGFHGSLFKHTSTIG